MTDDAAVRDAVALRAVVGDVLGLAWPMLTAEQRTLVVRGIWSRGIEPSDLVSSELLRLAVPDQPAALSLDRCEWCRGPMPKHIGSGRARKTCSSRCRTAASRARVREVESVAVPPYEPLVREPVAESSPVRYGVVLGRVRAEYLRQARELLAAGESLDRIVLADVDRAAGAKVGYAKRRYREWRAELAALSAEDVE